MHTATPSAGQNELAAVLSEFHTESGRSLLDLLDESPVLLIFLRHFGCAFCRQAIDQVSQIHDQIVARGVRPVFVHLGTPERALPYFDYYHLTRVERVSNLDGSLYRNPIFHLPRVNPWLHFLIPAVWRGWLAGAIRKHGIGPIREDAHQMPGLFFLKNRAIANAYRYRTIADEPDYLKLIR